MNPKQKRAKYVCACAMVEFRYARQLCLILGPKQFAESSPAWPRVSLDYNVVFITPVNRPRPSDSLFLPGATEALAGSEGFDLIASFPGNEQGTPTPKVVRVLYTGRLHYDALTE